MDPQVFIVFALLVLILLVGTGVCLYYATRSHEWHVQTYGLADEAEPERLKRLADEFNVRKVAETVHVRERFANAVVNGKRVVAVGDVVWWPQTDATIVLGAVKFDDGTYAAIGLEADGSLVIPKHGRLSWPTKNFTTMPRLEFDDDGHIAVWFANERYIMAEHHSRKGWEYTGIGSSGSVALREFAKHGMSFSIEEGPPIRH